MKVKVALHKDINGVWIAECLNMPGCVSEGATQDEALQMLKDAMRGWLAVMREDYPDLEQRLPNVDVLDIDLAA
jgi:predicted RNase H-like HicB family nuclease